MKTNTKNSLSWQKKKKGEGERQEKKEGLVSGEGGSWEGKTQCNILF